MSSGYRFKREVALARASALVEMMQPTCEQIEIAGSIRRGKETVGDIEIVAVPRITEIVIPGQLDLFGGRSGGEVRRTSALDQKLEEMITSAELFRDRPHAEQKGRWGEKQKTLWAKIPVDDGIAYIQVDLFIVTPPAQWGPIFTIRTGPEDFTGARGLMTYINRSTPYQQVDGRLIIRATGEEVQTPTERSYFKALGLPYIEMGERTSAKLWQVAKTAKKNDVSGFCDQIETPKLTVTRVVNIRDLPPGEWQNDPQYVYIGRANPSYGLPESPYHNPFKLSKNEPRGSTLARFEAYIRSKPDLLAKARRELSGKMLVCWCAPQPCHGDVLARLIAEPIEKPKRELSGNGYQIDDLGAYMEFVKGPEINRSNTIGLPPDFRFYGARLAVRRGLIDEEVRAILRDRLEARAGIAWS